SSRVARGNKKPARGGRPCFRRGKPLQRSLEIPDLPFGFIACNAVAFLHLAGQVLGVAFGFTEVVVGKAIPLRLDLAGQLLPLPLEAILIHVVLLSAIANVVIGSASPAGGGPGTRLACRVCCFEPVIAWR